MLEVHVLRALKDNYIYILYEPSSRSVAAVDPSEASPVFAFLREKNWSLDMILCTHHHPDHVGGNTQLQDEFRCPIYCSQYDFARVPGSTHGLKDNATFLLGQESITALHVPGHTSGALAYYAPASHVVFTGDTLFTQGCGRLFEGTLEQMWTSLTRLRNLPVNTQVYSGHEYGLNHATFAAQEMPQHHEITEHFNSIRGSNSSGIVSVPSTIARERRLNPFLLCSSLAQFAALRRRKDEFRLEPDPSIR